MWMTIASSCGWLRRATEAPDPEVAAMAFCARCAVSAETGSTLKKMAANKNTKIFFIYYLPLIKRLPANPGR
jgi:hypothetical protein